MKRKFGGEMILLICAIILCVVAAVAYIKKDDDGSNRIIEVSKSMKSDIALISGSLTKVEKEFSAMADITSSELFDIQKRLLALEKKPQASPDVNLKFSEPLKVSLVYREAKRKPLIPTSVNTVTSGKSNSLMDRAGFIKSESAQ